MLSSNMLADLVSASTWTQGLPLAFSGLQWGGIVVLIGLVVFLYIYKNRQA